MQPRAREQSRAFALVTLFIGVLALLSWGSPAEALRGLGAGGVQVNPVAALAVIIAGVGLLLLAGPRPPAI